MRACRRFLAGIPHRKVDDPRVTHPSATLFSEKKSVRLACVRHAASVYPEPGSNSPFSLSISSSPPARQRRRIQLKSSDPHAHPPSSRTGRWLVFADSSSFSRWYTKLTGTVRVFAWCIHVDAPALAGLREPVQEPSTVPVLLSTSQLFKVLSTHGSDAHPLFPVYAARQIRRDPVLYDHSWIDTVFA
jgi:hypothetical protein